MQVMEGGRKDDVMAFCLKPGMETVTHTFQVPGASTSMRHDIIAAQCCTASGECRRKDDDGVCIAGFSSNVAPYIAAMTYGETAAACATRGLQLCDQSCQNTGCLYNRHPVFTSKPCPTKSPLSPSPPPPPPSTPSPLTELTYSPWAEASITALTRASFETIGAFRQRCLHACADSPEECVGLREAPCGTTLCCSFYSTEQLEVAFFVPTNGTYIPNRLALEHEVRAKEVMMPVELASSIAISIQPWDDSYGGDGAGDNSTTFRRDAGVKVEAFLDGSDWMRLSIAVVLGVLLGMGSILLALRLNGPNPKVETPAVAVVEVAHAPKVIIGKVGKVGVVADELKVGSFC